MEHVTGIGGVFFKTPDPAATREWYRQHLGIASEEYGYAFHWHEGPEKRRAYTIWAPFSPSSTHFDGPAMINYRVRNLPELLEKLKAQGVELLSDCEQHENGKFAWIRDGDGNKVELWEPIPPEQDPYLPKE